MIAIKRILCPVDLSTDPDHALRYAAALSRAYNAKLFVCHSAKPLATATTGARSVTSEDINRLVEQTIDIYAGGINLNGLDWESVVVEGSDPAEAITSEAARRKVDLIVMRSRRRPHRAALLGSTAEKICRTAPCPVLVTHEDESEFVGATTGEIDLRRVLVAYDFSNDSELALRYGLSLAQEYQAELNLLHVLPPAPFTEPEIKWVGTGADGEYHKAARRLQQAVPAEAHAWCQVKHSVRYGKPYREILAYAREQEIDLVCIGAHGEGFGMSALFGSNTDRVLRQAPCPVLVTRPLKPANF